jgi:hypothetical protein
MPTLLIVVDTEASFVKVTSMAVLRVSCLDLLNVLGGFFVSGKRWRLIGASASLGVARHGTMVEGVYNKWDSRIGVGVLGMKCGRIWRNTYLFMFKANT